MYPINDCSYSNDIICNNNNIMNMSWHIYDYNDNNNAGESIQNEECNYIEPNIYI